MTEPQEPAPTRDRYNNTEIESALSALPPEMQEVVRAGLASAHAERKEKLKTLQYEMHIAEFAVAVHINTIDQDALPAHVDVINWSRFSSDLAQEIVENFDQNLVVELPESVKLAAVMYFLESNMHRLQYEDDEVEEKLRAFGYTVDDMLGTLAQVAVDESTNNGKTVEEVKQALQGTIEEGRTFIYPPRFEPKLRDDLKKLGYSLPELQADKSYGYSEDDGETYPAITADMLPSGRA